MNARINILRAAIAAGVLSVIPVSACNAQVTAYSPDFDKNGYVDTMDLFKYLGAWFVSDIGADVNYDGKVQTTDLFDFVNIWVHGYTDTKIGK